ncbi:hypothetical protein [Cupriavidus agavae]|uniref:Lipoprotein n=1 Tax=Cupriavidus agavae TaxID=1001822 RepID=A0A4Q7RBN5_9BURK|nr:hypothetical protein [Cupriavidus agavae]RZT29042.1 hypothetical protein EV147_5139 [Cupriavidus agavae]
MRAAARAALPVIVAAALSGCSSVGDVAGAVAGVAAGTASANPAVAIGVAIGVKAATDATAKYVFRTWHTAEQDSIAAIIGTTPPGTAAPWEIRHRIPYENRQGTVRVVREIRSALADCREALFSVEEDKETRWFQVVACRQETGWKWASAEPAVPRWGSLQ